jgi:hypothetical protein
MMVGNGHGREIDEGNESARVMHLIAGSGVVEAHIRALVKASDALIGVGRVFQDIVDTLSTVTGDVSRALSENVGLKHHLKNITAREQELRKELDDIKWRLPPLKPLKPKKQRSKHKRRKT